MVKKTIAMKILFGVFDWGLGHATRDLPLIKALLDRGDEVHIISTGRALILLRNHFKGRCAYFDVPSLHSVYNSKYLFKVNFALSAYKIVKSQKIAKEKSRNIISEGNYDKVISDCRFDVYDKLENSYLINHQLRLHAPFGSERILEIWMRHQTKHFGCLLVPDFEDPNLTGRLSRDLRYVDENKIRYIGILSQLKKKNVDKDIDYFISLSGPEKTRKDLLAKLIKQRSAFSGKVIVAGGTPENKDLHHFDNIEFHGFLDARQQEEFMNRAKFVIIRAGYTTIMELIELDIRDALLIPSPGQSEQVNISKDCDKKNIFHYVSQRKLDLFKDLKSCCGFNGFAAPWKTQESVKKFLDIINNSSNF